MNICFLTLGHVSKMRGGVDRVTDTLTHSFMKQGHNVINVSVWDAVDGDIVYPFQYILPSKIIDSQDNINFLTNLFSAHKIDIIINQSEPVSLLKLIVLAHSQIPIVSVIHTDPYAAIKSITDTWDKWKYTNGYTKFLLLSPYYFIRKVYQKYTRTKFLKNKYTYYYNECDAIVLLSERFKPSFCKLTHLKGPKHLYAIPNPYSFSGNIINRYVPKEKIILFVGRLEFSPKRVDRLINIWDDIKNKNGWELLILGDGPDKTLYENICKDKNVQNITFLGQQDPMPYYQKASIICITSTHEGLPLVALEALQNGVIPISFNSYEAIYDIITDNYNGFIIDSFSIKKYKETLENLINNDELRNSIMLNIIKYSDTKFEQEQICQKWLNLLNKISKNGHN